MTVEVGGHDLLTDLTDEQRAAVTSTARRLLVVAGAGSGKTEAMSRRISWWLTEEGIPKDQIVAFTFTEKAAEEMKFRIRKWVGRITPPGEDATLGGMYIGTIHGFCLQMLQELVPQVYGVYDILDDVGRLAMIQRWYWNVFALKELADALGTGQFETISAFLRGYDLLNEHASFEAEGPEEPRPTIGPAEESWIGKWRLLTDVGDDEVSKSFARSAARYYGALHARRLLDFSTAQLELVRILKLAPRFRTELNKRFTHLVVDEFQDVNPVQDSLVQLLVGDAGKLTCVGDHRQAIFEWRGGRVEIMEAWHQSLTDADDGEVLELPHNFRSTPRVVELANAWAETIASPRSLGTPRMEHGNTDRLDFDESHVAIRHFDDREAEAVWIAESIGALVHDANGTGVRHDAREGDFRGLGLPDIAVLVRSSTHLRILMDALEERGIPAVVRAGPDLFRRPEVLMMIGALALTANTGPFWGNRNNQRSMPGIVQAALGCGPDPEEILVAACDALISQGLMSDTSWRDNLVLAATLIQARLAGDVCDPEDVGRLRTDPLRRWLSEARELRRVFPQTLYQWLASEAGVFAWDAQDSVLASSAMFHLGQLSGLITGIETPGWVTPGALKWQLIALTNWGARSARSEEAPLLVPPNAVTISTIHSAKGLEFPVVFLADVNAAKFPSNRARRLDPIPFAGAALAEIGPDSLIDTENHDGERRLMYVALTRAERFLFVSASGPRTSKFKKDLNDLIDDVGGQVEPAAAPSWPAHRETDVFRAFRLVTSFSDLRYYLECPHDYYLRKVLGFAPTIDQAFGYGRGIHNLMRDVHLRPREFAEMADDRSALEEEAQRMIDQGLFYLRYTTGDPLENMKRRAKQIVAEYVETYEEELATLEFEAERPFETLIEEADVLVSGAIDLIRHDDPPRVALIDFKSGDPEKEGENASSLDRDLMQLQVSLYAVAAKKELQFEPDLGIVRYLGVPTDSSAEDRELLVPLGPQALEEARQTIIGVTESIQGRHWEEGPRRGPRKPQHSTRCEECDFLQLCGRPEAAAARTGAS